jgi:hypothetical protein
VLDVLRSHPRFWLGWDFCFALREQQSFFQHREYILWNPVKAGLVEIAEQYPYSFTCLAKKKAQGLKPKSLSHPERPD